MNRVGLLLNRFFLLLFPRRFRAERGAEMERVVGMMCQARAEDGVPSLLVFWLRLMWDTCFHAAREWIRPSRPTPRAQSPQHWNERMFSVMSDVRYAIRTVVRQPSYGLMIVVMMTLAIAGNAAVFRIFNGLFLRPLPFENPEQLVDLDETAPSWNLEFTGVRYVDFVSWRRENTTFAGMAVYSEGGRNLSGGDDCGARGGRRRDARSWRRSRAPTGAGAFLLG